MLGITKLRNPIQAYAWGSRTAIAGLQGRPVPSPRPEAELWMGAHPRAPSEAFHQGRWRSLPDLIRESPVELLGAGRAAGEGGLPFLFKVLAADEPLSIQAHPDAGQARRGCEREDAAGIARDAPGRNYRDPYPKPEILYAWTSFAMVRGFREPAETYDLLARLGVAKRFPGSIALRDGTPGHALESFFSAWMTSRATAVADALEAVVAACASRSREDPAFRWVAELAGRYPGDRGVLAPLLLNVVELSPGEAVFTGPGILHAYLRGVGVELMSSSDNVLRGGLTPKHVDVPELLDILRFEPLAIATCAPLSDAHTTRFEDGGLRLDVLDVRPEQGELGLAGGWASILLCGAGRGVVRPAGAGLPATDLPFVRGDSFFVPANVEEFRIEGSATLFRASGAVD